MLIIVCLAVFSLAAYVVVSRIQHYRRSRLLHPAEEQAIAKAKRQLQD